MLVHILAIAVGLGSVLLYLAAFFFPEVHRKHDFFWSGVGCFYALVLWADAGQITSTELVGHVASISLVAWFGCQTLSLRRKRTPRDLQTPLTDESWQVFRQEMTSLGTAWLKRLPIIGGLFPVARSEHLNGSVEKEGLRTSSLKQVDYEFVDELPLASSEPRKGKPTIPPSLPPKPSPPPTSGLNHRATPFRASKSLEPRPETGGRTSVKLDSKSKPIQKPQTLLQKGWILKDWLIEVVTAATKPKPGKPVIVIPPRQPANGISGRPGKEPDTSQTKTSAADSQTKIDQDGENPERQNPSVGIETSVTLQQPTNPAVPPKPGEEMQNWADDEDGIDDDD